MIDLSLTEEQTSLQRTIRDWVNAELKPVVGEFEDDHEGRLAHGVIQKAAEAGILALPVPEDYGGAGASGIEINLVLEELAAGCGGIATAIGASWFGQTPILIAGTREQRERFFRPMTDKAHARLACMAMTEPAGGSDIENPEMDGRTIATRIRFDGDEIVVEGQKMWPSNAGIAYVYTTVATVDPHLGGDGSCIVVVEDGRPGLTFGKAERKMGMHADRNSAIFYDNVRVPRANLLGKVGDGLKLLNRTLVYNRTGTGSICVGMARGAFDRALGYAKERTITGKPMTEHPVVASKLADLLTDIDAARLLTWRAAWYNAQRGKESMTWSTMAKVYASDMAMRVTTDCVQLMGSNGYSKEYGVEKYMRDAKIVQIYIGANELCRQVIGHAL